MEVLRIGFDKKNRLVIQYKDSSLASRERIIPVPELSTTASIEKSFIPALMKRHQKYLQSTSKAQLLRILTKLQARMSGAMKTAPASIGVTAPRSSIEDEDLNKVSEEELKRKKEEMDELFKRNRITKEDDDFQYDVRKDFQPVDEDNEWDEEEVSDEADW